MSATPCSIFFHNYYGGHADWLNFFNEKVNIPFTLYYNIVESSIFNQEDISLEALQQAGNGPWLKKLVVRRSPNLGKDIGGKLVLMDACLRQPQQSEYIILLHDKKSPYKIQNKEWRDKLFQIIEPEFIKKAIALFSKHAGTGIIAPSDSIYNEYSSSRQTFISHNGFQLARFRSELGISNTDYRYVAGTMFWARSRPLLDFFRKNPPLDIRKQLENGNVMDETNGTNTHAWERLLCWLIFAQGYTINGI